MSLSNCGRTTVRAALAGLLMSASVVAWAQAPASAPPTSSQRLSTPNPFVPPSQRIDRKLLENAVRDAVREELKDMRRTTPGLGSAMTANNGVPTPPGMAGLPSQGGAPSGVSTASGAGGSIPEGGPVDELLADGGRFIGCADGTPIFSDKEGRRVYFTTRELQRSIAPRRVARCSA